MFSLFLFLFALYTQAWRDEYDEVKAAVEMPFPLSVSEEIEHREEFSRLLEEAQAEMEEGCLTFSSKLDIFQSSRPAILESMVNFINTNSDGKWTAAKNPRSLCGTFLNSTTTLRTKPPRASLHSLPSSFDSRSAFPHCPSIGHIRDQAKCGSCWAFSTTETLNDRICIKSKGEWDQLLSPSHTLACCSKSEECFSFGCDGGEPAAAWRWFSDFGVVSGADYEGWQEKDTCWPYTFHGCAHHVPPSKGLPSCKGNGPTPSCRDSCPNLSYKKTFEEDKHYAEDAYQVESTIDAIKQELMEKGPVSAAFTVYEDFEAYKSGVYHHVTGKELGGHAVKIIGWGEEEGEGYWLVANSWNPTWGEGGLFRIKFGECGIDSDITAGEAAWPPKGRRRGEMEIIIQ